jgi:hypothetical protein
MAHGSDSDGGLPGWLSGSKETLRSFANNPEGFVLGIVATWIVGGILTVGRTVVDSILLAFDSVVGAFDLAAAGVVGALESTGSPVLTAAEGMTAFIASLAAEAGPAAPVIAVGILAFVALMWYRFGKAILLEIPVLGGFLEFLGVNL